jgi:hypothetical protein
MTQLSPSPVSDREREAPSFEAFFQSEYARLVRALYLLTGSLADAEEAAQEAMARVYERWDRVGAMDSPVGYLYRVALHVEQRRRYRLALQARRLRPPNADTADPAAVAEAKTDVQSRASASSPVLQAHGQSKPSRQGTSPQASGSGNHSCIGPPGPGPGDPEALGRVHGEHHLRGCRRPPTPSSESVYALRPGGGQLGQGPIATRLKAR